jgi:glycosyltransferase involved in cell wall biosynthesis
MNNPLINILTRTSNRPNGFDITYHSVKNQTYKNIKHIVSYDDDNDLSYLGNYGDIELVKIDKMGLINNDNSVSPNTGKYSPHNLYFNEMVKYIDSGWIIYLDDDDEFTDETVIEKIVNVINENDEDTLIFWQFKLGENWILPKDISKNIPPVIGNIGGSTIAFNIKYKDIAIWDSWKCSDFRVIDKLYRSVPKIKFIKDVLVLAPIPGSGNKIDIIK